MNWGHYLFGFSGRINRAKLWLWLLIYFLVLVVAVVIAITIVYFTDFWVITLILYLILGIGGFVSYLAVFIKRLHDRDKSGWWLLIFLVLPSVLVGIALSTVMVAIMNSGGNMTEMPELSPLAMITYLIGAAIGLWFFVEVFCLRGTVGPNKYGPDPLGGM